MDAAELGGLLWKTAEPGFKEWATHRILNEAFRNEGFALEELGDFPGFTAGKGSELNHRKILVIADMDALPNPEGKTGEYIHSCGHHIQMAVLFGAAQILKNRYPDVLNHISFTFVPAEEYIDFPLREALKEQGKISFFSGKLELLDRGYFDHAEYVVAIHASGPRDKKANPDEPAPVFINSVRRMSGFKVMTFNFKGSSAHAGAAPHKGINAQNAASLFLQACAFLRESFAEEEHIRIHPILKLPQDQSVNLIPALARVETYVRAAGLNEVNTTVDKLIAAAEGCARALGAEVEVTVEKGYSPFLVDKFLHNLAEETAGDMGVLFTSEEFSAASSDVGDISLIKPTVMLGLPGSNGRFHNPDFRVIDPQAAYGFSPEFLAEYLHRLAVS